MKQEKSCGCVVFDSDKVLLIHHNDGHWDLPKGHIENGETEVQTAIREVKEETNIDVQVNTKHRYITEYSPMEGVWKEVIFFIATKLGGEPVPQESEVQEVGWFSIEEAVEKITYDNTREVLKSAIRDFESEK